MNLNAAMEKHAENRKGQCSDMWEKNRPEHGFRRSREKRSARKAEIRRDIERYGREILNSEELRKAYNQTHHTWSTVGEHTMRVAAASLAVCYLLRRVHVKTDIPAVVKGSLCHDLGILGRDEKYASRGECSRKHPADSVEVARRLIDNLPEKSADIIERHMWPAGGSKAPNSIEGIIVSAADKYAAVKDLLKGSELRHTGVKEYLIKKIAKKENE